MEMNKFISSVNSEEQNLIDEIFDNDRRFLSTKI